MERRFGLPGMYEGFAIVALLASPFVSLILPHDLASRQILPHTDWKDAINILLIAAFAAYVLSRRLLRDLIAMLRWDACYRHVEHNFFYQEDGTVLVRSTFVLLAGWKEPIATLPQEGFLWFKDIERDKIHYRLVQRGRVAARRIKGELPQIRPCEADGSCDDAATSELSWRPSIQPPLRRKEAITYQVEVLTPGTETAAFTPAGTNLGFGIALPTSHVSLRAYAPIGFEFQLLAPEVSMRDFLTAAPIAGTERETALPMISPDGTILELQRSRPRPARRTWVHYRFHALEGGVQREIRV